MKHLIFAAAIVGVSSVALAHQNVRNPSVKARMEAMEVMAAATKSLGLMVKEEAPFDSQQANLALLQIGKAAAETPDLFANPETDPVSEALPEIWEDFDDFAERSLALETLAQNAADVATLDDARMALGSVGRACKSCHEVYRQP